MQISSTSSHSPTHARSRYYWILGAACRLLQHKRTLATFINAVVRAGLQIEQLVEGEFNAALAQESHADPSRWYSAPRAQLMPTTFILKARKPLMQPQ